MALVKFRLEVTGLDSMQNQFAKGANPVDFRQIGNFEKTLDQTFRAVRTATHQETGYLRGSVEPISHFDGSEWSGEVEAARDPGIFELARGNIPTARRPEGGHFFFNAVEPFIPMFADNVDAVFRAIFDENAPI